MDLTPIETVADLKHALAHRNRVERNFDGFKRYAMRRAKELGVTHLLPQEWNREESTKGVKPKPVKRDMRK